MKKKNDIVGDQEFEQLLKDRMNELSSSVDCFDKISARAFPEKDSDFSDSEFTVSDLENVTGRRKTVPVLKWTAAAAAIVLFVGILPKTAFVQEFLSNIGGDNNNQYRSILAEISTETNEHTYKIYDMTLKDYIEKDVLVTPFYNCPFDEMDKDGINVRVYVRMIHDYPTNQIYAVEYKGDYNSGNILAAADSKAKFSDEEVSSIDFESGFYDSDNDTRSAISSWFTSSKADAVMDNDGNAVFLASYSIKEVFKLNDDVMKLTADVIYNKLANDNSGVYYYDIRGYRYSNGDGEAVSVPGSEKLWKRSLSFDCSSAMPEESHSLFRCKDYFSADNAKSEDIPPSYYMPYYHAGESLLKDGTDHLEIDYKPNGDYQIDTFDTIDSNEAFTLDTSDYSEFKSYDDDTIHISNYDIYAPADVDAKKSLRIYISALNFLTYSSFSDPTINIKINDSDDIIKIRRTDIGYNTEYVEKTASEQEKAADNDKINEEIMREIESQAEKAERIYEAPKIKEKDQ